MKLLELYSLSTGLKIGKQHLVEAFYPLEFDRYITLQAGSGMAAKNYPRYVEVLGLLLPHLTTAGIKVVQLGGKDDPALPGCVHTQGLTNLHQSNYLLRRSLLHIGNDSWLSHRGGELGVPLVISFGPTTPQNHGPYRSNPKSVFIESHRFGRRATFASQEAQSTIGVIPPEQIVNAALSTLGLTPLATRQSLFFGDSYHAGCVEVVPTIVVAPHVQIAGAPILRMDYVPQDTASWTAAENGMIGNLQLRKCSIVTDREINPNHLAQLKPNVVALRVEVDKVSAAWIKTIKRLGIQVAFFSAERDPERLAARRLELYDACLFDHFTAPTREDLVKAVGVYLNRKELGPSFIGPNLKFSTNKFLLADNKVYLSKAHWQAGLHTPETNQNSAAIIDSGAFFEECAHFYLYSDTPVIA